MTISSKLADIAGLSFAVSDETDPIDVGGFSDPIQTVDAKSAKFSGGGDMKANSGLRIGMTQLKINTGGATPGLRTEVAADFVGWAANGNTVDNNETTFVSTTNGSAVAVIDYGSIATRDIRLVTRMTATQPEFGSGDMALLYEISDDNITYTVPVTSPTQFQFLNIPEGGDMMGGATLDTGIVGYNDVNTQSFRYVRITPTASGSGSAKTWYIYQVTEQDVGAKQVTVRVRGSNALDTADGDIIINDQIMNENETLTFTTDLLLTGEGQYVTLQIVSLTDFDIPVTLSEITSIQEV